ncbi:hypothetical protein P9J83_07555 [Clostridium sporogenes]|uniref:Uncharacterized protein n=1 Tax=Clostridium sporogenes TaxID=1509 RepID=A0AAE4FKP4_CLOSG|nr:hypothetical protein [Clostridium sporogenes]MDS1003349.1 hypothetical protein [Clostridium sporogenes]
MEDFIIKFFKNKKIILTILGTLIVSVFMREKDLFVLEEDNEKRIFISISNTKQNI